MASDVLTIGLALGVLAAGCSQDTRAQRTERATSEEHQPTDAQGRPAGIPAQDRMMQGMTDADFVAMMIAHHRQGIEMARLEEANGTSADVRGLAARIRQTREGEIQEMEAHARGRRPASDQQNGVGEHPMPDQQGRDAMDRLRTVSGPALDQAFLEEMARQDERAVRMVQITTFQDGDLKKLADQMASDRRQELDRLTAAAHASAR
jgi:uncharacterized protein (DUF305 family)